MKDCLSIVIVCVGVAPSLICATESEAGGYFMTDRDGKVISEDTQAVITIGPTDRTSDIPGQGGERGVRPCLGR